MDGRIMRTLAELIAEHHRRNWQNHRTDQYSAFDTTVSHDLDGDIGDGGRDAGRDPDHPGQSGDNFPG